MNYKVVSLFSGGGGLDLGFIWNGYEIVWAIDIEKNAVETYRANIGDHIICEDIRKVDLDDIPKADIIIGGPPCQSFSMIGKRDVMDERGMLVWRYIDIIKHVQPKAFVFENVTGILSAKNREGKKVIEELMKAFEDIGYCINWKVMNAVEYGVPQKRKRVIIVGLKGNKKFNFPEATHGDKDSKLIPYVSVSEALGDLPNICDEINDGIYYRVAPSTEYQKFMRLGSTVLTEHDIPTMSELDQYIIKYVKPGGNYMDIPSDVNSARIKRLQKEGGRTTCYGRLHPDNPAYTINTYFNRPNVGCNIHYKENRLITVREALRLQSFPDSYKLVSSSKQGKNLIVGNAVPPILSDKIAKELKKALKELK